MDPADKATQGSATLQQGFQNMDVGTGPGHRSGVEPLEIRDLLRVKCFVLVLSGTK